MKLRWLGGLVLFAALPASGQDAEDLKRQLADKEAEVRQLRARIGELERALTPARIATASKPALPEDGREDSNRALERALVRENGMVLPVGRFEIEPNFVYSHSADRSADFRRNAYGPALAARVGLPLRLQLELTLPYVHERRDSGGNASRSRGAGDATLGVAHQLLDDSAGTPALIAALSYQAATGRNTVFSSAQPVALGSGFESLQASLTAVKRADPLVYFGSYSYTHTFADTKGGIEIDPGRSHGVRFGAALAASPEASLRAALNLNFYSKTRIGGVALHGSDDHAAAMELGGSVVLSESTALDVLLGAGLTSNAPKYRLGVALPIRY